MKTLGRLFGIISILGMLLGFIPLLGWLNWLKKQLKYISKPLSQKERFFYSFLTTHQPSG